MKMNLLLAASCVAIMAAPSMAFCSISNGNDAKDAGKPLVDCWIYPEDGGEGKVVKLEEGAKAPEGYAFQPAPISEDVSPEKEDAAEDIDLSALEAERDKLVKDNAKQAETISQADAKIERLEGEANEAKAAIKVLGSEAKDAKKTIESQAKLLVKAEEDISELKATAKTDAKTIETQANEIQTLNNKITDSKANTA